MTLLRGMYHQRQRRWEDHLSTPSGAGVVENPPRKMRRILPQRDTLYVCGSDTCGSADQDAHIHCVCGEPLPCREAPCRACQSDHAAHQQRGREVLAGCQVCHPVQVVRWLPQRRQAT